MTGKSRENENVIKRSSLISEEGKMELYLYSLRKMAEQNVESNRNLITNLHNLRAFFYLCGEMIMERPDENYAVILMDIAQFKAVNEFYGRSAGDELLKFLADCFVYYEENRKNTYVCHVRADVFCLCTTYNQEEELVQIVDEISNKINDYSFPYKVLPAFGICASTEPNPAISYLKDCATMAMNTIKGKFFASYAFFDDNMREMQLREKQVENDIVDALANEEFALYIQPKVNMETGKVIGGEALVRWIDPERGIIRPMEFIPVLEKNGFIINVDMYVWERVFAFLGKLIEEGKEAPLPISINVSRVHAFDKNFVATLCNLRDKYHVPAELVPLELTESAFLADEEGLFQKLAVLREQGFVISMDDFGTGFSTMNMLKKRTLDEIKIDRVFIMDIDNKKSKIIVSHTIDMLNDLDVNIIVEGVETPEQKKFLLKCGCQCAQGFLFYRPMPVQEFEKLLQEQNRANALEKERNAEVRA